MDRLNLLIT